MTASFTKYIPTAAPFTELLGHGVTLRTLRILRCSARLSSSQLTFLARTGAYWVLPILERPGSEVLALRLQPGVPLPQSPLLLLSGSGAVTLSATASDLVPAVLAWDAVSDSEAWAALQTLEASEWDQLTALHALCGGASDLTVLQKLIHQSALQQLVHGQDEAEKERAVCDFLVQSLPQPTHQRYRQYLRSLRDGIGAVMPLPEAGAFDAAVAARAFLHASLHGDREAVIAAGCAVFSYPPTLDTAVREGSGQVCVPDAFSGDLLCYQAAQALKDLADEVPASFRHSAVWPAVMALASGDLLADCDGQPFRQAASQLAQQGSPEAAYTCLLWSAACSYSSSGRTDTETLHHAVELAEAAHWPVLHQNLLAMTALRDPDQEAQIVAHLDALASQLLS